MKKKVNNCCDCGKPCMSFCPLRDDSFEYYCDECGDETTLYYYDGKELCANCIIRSLEKVN